MSTTGKRSSHRLKLPLPLPLPLPPPQHPPRPPPSAALPLPPPPPPITSSSSSSHDENIHPHDTRRLHILGHGSGGKVYKVAHNPSGKIYALKIIHDIQDWDAQSVGNRVLQREIDILRRFSCCSPNVIRCYGAAASPGEISLVLEYMDGGSLADILDRHHILSERHISHVARHVLRGLAYLHSNRIAHRDIKPSNLLLNRQLEVKIADFGVSAVLANTLAKCTSFVGTCAYMSPERFDQDSHGGSYCGFAADIWSLGLSLLECATGHFPFLERGKAVDWPSLMVAICYGEPPLPPPEASPQFRDFIMRCLQKDPARRPRAAALLSHPFVARDEGYPADMRGLLDKP